MRGRAFADSLSIADVEACHAGNRRRAHHRMSWSHFAAQAVNQTAKQHKMHRDKLAAKKCANSLALTAPQQGAQPALPNRPKSAPIPLSERQALKAQSALCLFRREWMATAEATGEKYNPCSLHHWATIKDKYAELPEERRRNFEEQAELEPGRAKVAREVDKASRAGPLPLADGDAEPAQGEQAALAAADVERYAYFWTSCLATPTTTTRGASTTMPLCLSRMSLHVALKVAWMAATMQCLPQQKPAQTRWPLTA